MKTTNRIVSQALSKHGKSFYWASLFLGQTTAKHSSYLYYFCRKLDDIADSKNKNSKKILISIKSQILNKNKPGKIYKTFVKTKKLFNIKDREIIDLINGLLIDKGKVEFMTEKELIRYSYHVAGCVGLMMCPILGCKERLAKSFAIDLGIAMQLTNIARDIKEDANMNRRYLPGNWIDFLSPKDIIKCSNDPNSKNYKKIQKGINKILLLAEKYYKSGNAGLVYLPFKSHLSIAVASKIYRQIGKKIINNNCDWNRRIYTNIFEKIFFSFFSLISIIDRFKKYPLHNNKLHKYLIDYI